MLEVLSGAVFIILYTFGIYFAAISIFGLLRPKQLPEPETTLRFAALIPTRNEQARIGGIVENLQAHNYPPDMLISSHLKITLMIQPVQHSGLGHRSSSP